MAGYVNYLDKSEIENYFVDIDDEDEDSSTFTTTGSSEENENQGSNMFEILEKINSHVKFCFKISDFTKLTKEQEFFHLDLFSILKASLNTPPPEVI